MAEQSGQQIGLVAACKRLGVLWSSLSVSSPPAQTAGQVPSDGGAGPPVVTWQRRRGQTQTSPFNPPDKTKLAKFESKLGTKIELNRAEGETGKLVIHFYSEEELQAIFDAILGKDEQL